MKILNRIQFRVILLILIISGFFIVGLYYLRDVEARKIDSILKDRKQEKSVLLSRVINVLGQSLYQFAFDYSYWDEMLEFVKTGDKKWAYENIETVLPTFNSHAAWVLKPDLSLVYSINTLDSPSLNSLPFDPEILRDKLKKNSFFHYYIPFKGSVLEIQGAPIQPTADIRREAIPAGYFVVARNWDDEHINELSALTSGTISPSSSDSQIKTNSGEDRIILTYPLSDLQGRKIKSITFESRLPMIAEIQSQANFLFIYGLLFSLIVIATLSFFLFRYVSNPVSKIYESLENEDPEAIEELKASRTEFGNLAVIISEFFRQKSLLVDEIENRKLAEAKLKESNEELLQLNEKLMVSEIELRELNISKDKFFSILAHDLKSPYQGLIGISQILSNEIESLSNEDIRTLSGEMYRTVKNQYRLLENLLEWSRIQIGKEEFRPEDIELRLLVSSIFSLLSYNAEKKCIEMKNCISQQKTVFADMHMLRSILVNLVTNAIKFTNTRGEVSVSCSETDEYDCITVTDTGIGISSEDLAKIFRIDSHHTTRGTENEEGTGLGLILCKELVEKHGGEIRAESVLWSGSSFSFTLPKVQPGN